MNLKSIKINGNKEFRKPERKKTSLKRTGKDLEKKMKILEN
jgi:hypothetical protein